MGAILRARRVGREVAGADEGRVSARGFDGEEISMLRRVIGGSLVCSIGGVLLASSSAPAAAPHTVLPGETLWSIAFANNLTTRTVAVYNGVSQDAQLAVGATVYVPTVEEGAAALASGTPGVEPPNGVSAGGADSADPAGETGTTTVPDGEMGDIPSPYGVLHLVPAAAEAWNAMRAEALRTYGIGIYPGGPLSAYRTYAQQDALYRAFIEGSGAPANPPGTSSHEEGTAVDLASRPMRRVIDQIGWKFGWSKVHAPGEWWHVDYVGR
jgi:murein DD-endopeptidase MepM/ murein hydrolase activator NlpD